MGIGEKMAVTDVPTSLSLHRSLEETESPTIHPDLAPGLAAAQRQDALRAAGASRREIERKAPPAIFVEKNDKPDSQTEASSGRRGPTRRQVIGGVLGLGLIGLAAGTDLPRGVLSAISTRNSATPEPSPKPATTDEAPTGDKPLTPEVSSAEYWARFNGLPLERIPEPNPDGIIQGKGPYDSWVVYEPVTSSNQASTTKVNVVSPYVEKPVVSEPTQYGLDQKLYVPHIAVPTSKTETVELSISGSSIELGPISSGETGEYDYLTHTVSEQPLKDLMAWSGRVGYADSRMALIDEQFPIRGVNTQIYYPTLMTESQIVWDPKDESARGAITSAELLGHTRWGQIVDYLTGKMVFASAGGNNFQALFNARVKEKQIIADGGSVENGTITAYPSYLDALRVKSNYFTKGQKELAPEDKSRFENDSDMFAQMWIIASDQTEYGNFARWWRENRDTNTGQTTSAIPFWVEFNVKIGSAINPEKLKSTALPYLDAINELMSVDRDSSTSGAGLRAPYQESGPNPILK